MNAGLSRDVGACPYIIIQLLSLWPVWRWFLARIGDGSDEPWGVVALVTACLLLARGGKQGDIQSGLSLSMFFTLLYCISFNFLPALGRAALGVLGLATLLCSFRLGRKFDLPLWGLFILSLPLLPTLQFYLGYPLRVLTAIFAVPLIECSGFDVVREGTCLRWAGELLLIDAPCSGIKMMWGIMYLNYTLSALYSLTLAQTLITQLCSWVLIFGGNVVRTAILFFSESRIISAPHWFHQGVGLLIFCVIGMAVVCVVRRCHGRACAH